MSDLKAGEGHEVCGWLPRAGTLCKSQFINIPVTFYSTFLVGFVSGLELLFQWATCGGLATNIRLAQRRKSDQRPLQLKLQRRHSH